MKILNGLSLNDLSEIKTADQKPAVVHSQIILTLNRRLHLSRLCYNIVQ